MLNKQTFLLVEMNFKEKEKIKICPVGDVTGYDGRTYRIDGNSVVARTKEAGIDIVLEEEHYGGKASGWFDIKTFEVRKDGIYATLTLTNVGKEQVENNHYRYISPALVMDRNSDNREVLMIDSVGLVNKPNLLNKSLNKKESKRMDKKTDREISLKKEIQILKENNDKLLADIKKQKIETAIKAGELQPNKREFAFSLDEKMLNDFLELNKKDLKHLGKETRQDGKKQDELSSAEIEVNRQLGIEVEK